MDRHAGHHRKPGAFHELALARAPEVGLGCGEGCAVHQKCEGIGERPSIALAHPALGLVPGQPGGIGDKSGKQPGVVDVGDPEVERERVIEPMGLGEIAEHGHGNAQDWSLRLDAGAFLARNAGLAAKRAEMGNEFRRGHEQG